MAHAFLPFIAILALISGPEIPVSDAVMGPRPGLRFTPKVATNGDDYLIVWAEVAEIRAARVDGEGRVLDPGGIRVASGSGSELAVASDGRDYVIAYNCEVNSSPYSATPSVCLAHFDASSGAVERRGRLELASNPVIASARGKYLLVYQTPYSPVGFNGRFADAVEVAADGTVAGPPFRVGTALYPPQIASNGTDYFVIWSSYNDLKGVLVRGRTVDAERTLALGPASWGPLVFSWSVGSNGDEFMVVWQQNLGLRENRYVTELRSMPVTAAGLPNDWRQKILVTGDQPTWSPHVTWDGATYLVTYSVSPFRAFAPSIWDRSRMDIHELRLNADGAIVTPPASLAAREGSEAFSSAASNGASTLIAWERQPHADAANIEATLSHSQPLAVPVSVSAQQNLAGAEATVAWEEILGDDQKRTVFVRRLQGSGRGTPVAASEKHQVLPALSRSFIAWVERNLEQTTDEVFVKRTFANEPPRRLGAAGFRRSVAIAETASDALVVWVSAQRQIVGAWMQRGGEPFLISSDVDTHNPVVATDGENFLVLWEREESCVTFCFTTSLQAALVTSSGVVQPATTVAVQPVSKPSAVWNGSEYVVFWNRYGIVHAQRIQRSGLLTGATIEVRKDMFANNVIWTGREYLAAITGSAGFAPLTAARLDRDLRLIDSAAISNSYVPGTRVVLLDGWIAYQSRNADGISRGVARTLDISTVGKRRSAR